MGVAEGDLTMLGAESNSMDCINGERRSDRRYDLRLEARWKLIRRRRVLDTGSGQTIDLSSGGLLLEAGRPLPVGLNVELSVSWPVLLHNTAPLQLVVTGRIVRSEGSLAGIRMVQHEFRTVAVQTEQRRVAAAALSRRPAPFGERHVIWGKVQ
jgi:hypothetical protein